MQVMCFQWRSRCSICTCTIFATLQDMFCFCDPNLDPNDLDIWTWPTCRYS